ncbi:MAG: tetratricopeptide repeat protein [bacterium]|nr:tetratricopeptide repeat protein [bacterium]
MIEIEVPLYTSSGRKLPERSLEMSGKKKPTTSLIFGSPRTIWIALAVILAVGGMLRVAYMGELKQAPDFNYPFLDAEFHNYWARGLVFDDWTTPRDKEDPRIQTTPFFRPPGYPYFLAGVYKVLGAGYAGPRAVQMLLGLVNVLLAFFLGRRWFGALAALIFAGLMSTYWIFIYFEGELHAPVLIVMLLLVLTLLVGRWTEKLNWKLSIGSGLVLGLLALVRPNALLVAPAIIIWAFWLGRRRGCRSYLRIGALGLLIGLVLAIMPATIRNYRASGEFVPITASLGPNLFMGNNPQSNGLCDGKLPGYGKFATCYDWPAIVRSVEQKEGRQLSHSEASGHLRRAATRYMLSHPSHSLELLGRRFLLFWGPWEPTHNKVIEFERSHSRLLSSIPLHYPMMIALAAMGLWVLFRERRAKAESTGEHDHRWEITLLVLAISGAWFLGIMPFFVAARYRMPVIPFMMLFGAYGLMHLVNHIRARERSAAIMLSAVAVLAFIPASINFIGYSGMLSRWHFDRSICLIATGDMRSAQRELLATIKCDPEHGEAYIYLGSSLIMQRQMDRGISLLEMGVKLEPENANGQYNLGRALEVTGKVAESESHYLAALRITPDDQEVAAALERVRAVLAGGNQQ